MDAESGGKFVDNEDWMAVAEDIDEGGWIDHALVGAFSDDIDLEIWFVVHILSAVFDTVVADAPARIAENLWLRDMTFFVGAEI